MRMSSKWSFILAYCSFSQVLFVFGSGDNDFAATNEVRRVFQAKVEAIRTVDVMSQLDGYVREICFKEGAEVKKGDLLYLLDDVRLKCNVEQCKALLAAAAAELNRSKLFLDRINSADSRGTTQLERDSAIAQYETAKASKMQAVANLASAEYDLSRTRITASISGRIGVSAACEGTYVSPIREPLTRIMQFDPIRVIFTIPYDEYLQRRKNEESGHKAEWALKIKLPDGSEYEHPGTLDFVNNSMNGEDPSIFLGASFPNPKHLLVPNSFVTVVAERRDKPTSGK